MRYKLVVIGASYGGMEALGKILPALSADFLVPIVIVQHLGPETGNYMINRLNAVCRIRIKEAEEKEKAQPATAYFAPADYHLLIEDDMTMSLSVEQRINYARPSIDVLFESAAFALAEGVVAIILTGANTDGSEGIKKVRKFGGLTIAQDPHTALSAVMPDGAIATGAVQHVLALEKIAPFLCTLFAKRRSD